MAPSDHEAAIAIAARPEVVSPPDRLGSALEVWLSRPPSASWVQSFLRSLQQDRYGVPRLELEDDLVRLWLTTAAKDHLSELLDAVAASIETANEGRSAPARSASRDNHARESTGNEDDLDRTVNRWWSRHFAA
jgi:hypothetical protein